MLVSLLTCPDLGAGVSLENRKGLVHIETPLLTENCFSNCSNVLMGGFFLFFDGEIARGGTLPDRRLLYPSLCTDCANVEEAGRANILFSYCDGCIGPYVDIH